ncbi:unnamed protein product [Brachionus calyciflorus]|uniref:Tetraspanin n=1 Tax=Brachionus calyciflorus TaxID=104777 RepID=A0A813NTY5_9BILA|nr:unnamed protein product [Brachionus calyciflorus]
MRCRSDPDHVVEPILKYFLTFFNLVVFLMSICCIIGGSWLLYQRDSVQNNKTNVESVFDITTDLGAYLIAIGCIGIIFAIIGCAATIRESIFFLRIYMFILILITVLNLIVGVIFLIYSGKITTAIQTKLEKTYILNYYDDDEIKSLFDLLQGQYSCCGIQNYTDWNSNPYHNCNSTQSALSCLVPVSCCKDYEKNKETLNLFCSREVLKDSSLVSNINTMGCRQAIITLAQYGVKILSSCLVGITIILAITIVLVQYLLILIRKEQALYNAKNRYSTLDNDDEIMDYLN